MKPIVVAAMLSLVGAGQVLAADLPAPAPLPPANYFPAKTFSWSGPYFGLNGGYGFGGSSWTLGGASTGNFNTNGFLIGGTFGANFFEINGFVVGAEADFDWSNVGGNSSTAACAAVGGPVGATCTRPLVCHRRLGVDRYQAGLGLDRRPQR
jgi:outer membrane immunogenic protein